MMNIKKITIIGVGLIGGSFAKGLKESSEKNNLGYEITGYEPNVDNLKKAVDLGVVDRYEVELANAVQDADLILLGVPLGAMAMVLNEIRASIKPNAIITDVGSAKMSVISAVKEAFGEVLPNFVAGHPIAGKEKSGVEAACSDLFIDHRVVLTPTQETSAGAMATVRALWESLGACITEMAPEFHDEVFAATSHLPHLLAFSLVDLLNEHEELGNVFQYTAGGFRDFTRIASSDATMWRDISLSNAQAIVKWLRNYQAEIDNLIGLIEGQQSDALYELFHDAKVARDKHIVKDTL
ncbi:prephenate dehydrogenase/arogenate dehydrogenase family protein [Hydrogenovibrio sp. JE_KL2]|uniref:prephenate dehydrogenase n=1 Tax=Hydrogenovibrio sp. JE_KL2 TaxID=2651188 RepID=UPI001561CE3D|nr:prephenate dehydrogenase/arogenate dehydrogenase family protein [Hydrogenovibrio sp. JE_KL2]